MKINLISLLIVVGLCYGLPVAARTTERPDKSACTDESSSWNCMSDFAALLLVIKDSQELVRAWRNPTQQSGESVYAFYVRKKSLAPGAVTREQRIESLNKQFGAHFIRCSAQYKLVDIYKNNALFAGSQSAKYMSRALDWVKKGDSIIGGFEFEKFDKWRAVAEELAKKSSEA